MVTCWHCKAESPRAHYMRIVENQTALHGPWAGWRMSGRFLIAPAKACRITPERLLGMLWQELHRSRVPNLEQLRSKRAHIVLLPQRERFDGQA